MSLMARTRTHWRTRWRAPWRVVVGVVALVLSTPDATRAHEIPKRVAIQSFVHPDGRLLRVLVRVPLDAMRDVEFPMRGAYLDLATADSTLHDAARLWVADAITVRVDGASPTHGRIAAVRASVPSDRAFDTFASALATTTGARLDVSTEIPAGQVMLDVLLEFPLPSPDARVSIDPKLAHLGVKTTTVLRFVAPDGVERAYLYLGDPGEVQLDPAWWHAASRFVAMGIGHLLDGIDHLLFLLCLIIPVRRVRPLVGIVTAFTVAHSITLAASAFGYAPDALWFPSLVEVLIAASIVYMAIENIVGARLERRWLVAFGFGLVHGFGFSYVLRDSLQFAGGHLLTALASFNVGIEIGQLLVLSVAVPVLAWIYRRAVAGRTGSVVASVLIAHTAWHWMTERFDVLRTYRFSIPAMDTAFAIGMLRLAMGLLIVGAAAWAMSGIMARLASPATANRARHVTVLLILASGAACLIAPVRAVRAQSRTTMTGVYTAEQAKKGREVFTGACSGCHTVASHSGPVFAARWMGKPLLEFFDYVARLMPKGNPGALSEDEYLWVTAYVLKLNNMPAGARELSAEPQLLRAIRIDSLAVNAARSGVHEIQEYSTGSRPAMRGRTRLLPLPFAGVVALEVARVVARRAHPMMARGDLAGPIAARTENP